MLEKDVLTFEERKAKERRKERTAIITFIVLFVAYLLTCIVFPVISIIKWGGVVILGATYKGSYLITILALLCVGISYIMGILGIAFEITSRLAYLKHKREKRIMKLALAIIILLTCIFFFSSLTYKSNPVLSAWIILMLSCLGPALNIAVMIMSGKNITD